MQLQKLCRGEPIVEAKMFRKKTNSAASLDVADRTAKNLRLAACGQNQAQQHFHRGALTRTIRSQEAEDLTPGNIEGEVSDCHFAPENFAQPVGAYGKVGRSAQFQLSVDQCSEAARLKASDELPWPAREWITPFLIHNRLYRFPCESISVISVPSTPSTVTVS